MLSKEIHDFAKTVVERCHAAGLTLTTAESCTGGLIAAALTEVPGASRVFGRGVVTYANQAKTDLLGVPAALLAEHGAVDEEVCRAMAEGALARAGADLAVAVTGIAGPDGGSAEKPVGLVHIATARRGGATRHRRCRFDGDRAAVRGQSVAAALEMLLAELA